MYRKRANSFVPIMSLLLVLITAGFATALPASPTDVTKVPHYFGPYPNWANSPQALANAVVTISPAAGETAVTAAEATATVDPKTGGISAVTITSPGSGYDLPPKVSITAPGMTLTTPASATAEISTGVLTSITVFETGVGFTRPVVTLTGGAPAIEATVQPSGGADWVTLDPLTPPATVHLFQDQPFVEFSLPPPGGTQATGVAVFDPTCPAPPNCPIIGVEVVNPGSGYIVAPTVKVWDGPPANAVLGATATATMDVSRIDITNGGQGYTSAPTVTISGTVPDPALTVTPDPYNPAHWVPDGILDHWASALAAVAVKGAVTAITVTNPGTGYLTPGIKKFVDTLPGLTPAGANNLGQYIPKAVPDTTTYPDSDYYEIGVVQYRMKFHSDLPPTLLRGYVQLSTNVVPGNQEPLGNANLDPAIAEAPIAFKGVDKPHYLGPTIVATKNRPVRILFRNLLPTGVDGNLFLPVDGSIMGAGEGPSMVTLGPNNVPLSETDLGTVMDEVRNPVCGEWDGTNPKPAGCYSDNRATLHLHGGITPWISDGTPHQWTTPAGEGTDYPAGVSVKNVPDMPDPGPGAITFFYTNQQSARLMFYHDHAYGITRLNVYAGEAAGYVITDETEQKLIAPGGALEGLGIGTPLIIQDKTFVPSLAKMAQLDPTWDAARWGGEGNLWVPHVYMPAQNPGDPSGMSSFGRWMYGPWFWPPAKNAKYPPIANPYHDPLCDPDLEPFCEPALIPSTPNISVGMEAFNDTPLVNGTVYPTTTVDPKAYRFRILNAANDRFWNLSLYVADPTTGTLSEVALNPAELAAAQTDPVMFPTPDTSPTKSPKGPNWIQIGTEGGFLPAPVVVPPQPTTWITDPTRFDVGNVDKHSLLLAPAERADVIVDFSQFRGKTLILYNDAPAAFPARVPGYDYYTGGPDLSPSGAPTTLPGYGPNTRTIMQIKVSNAQAAVAFDRPNTTGDRLGALENVFKHQTDGSGVFESGQNPIIVGQAAYNSAYGSSFAASGYCNSATNPTAKCDGYARISEQGGDIFKFDTLFGTQLGIPLEPKGIHDEMNSASFDPWGRMTANLGLEAPGATPLLQNIILYPYVNPATEVLDSSLLPSSLDVTPISSSTDGTQIWKITHNGVDTHPIHFHLYDVQVLNRVAWDNIISPPDPTELGWKDTLRINPLQDTIVAVRPIVPVLPFALPDSIRPLNPAMPIGAQGSQNGVNGNEAGFNNTDAKGNPLPPIINELVDFDWEYVWHCHILSHEEMDMMRPVSVFVARGIPDAPFLTYTQGSIILNWTDGTPVNYADPTTWGNPKNEIGFRVERALLDTNNQPGAYTVINTALANTTTYTDASAVAGVDYSYRVVAFNAAGDSISNVVQVANLSAAPANLVATLANTTQVDLNWTDNASSETGYRIERATVIGGVQDPFAPLGTVGANVAAYSDLTVATGTTYAYRVLAFNAIGDSLPSNIATITLSTPIPALTVTPTTLTFGNQLINTVSATQTVSVSNTGTGPMTINNVVLGGADATQFISRTTCGPTLAAGTSCTISVTFSPSGTIGPRNALITVDVAAPAISQTVTLTGTAARPVLTVTPTTLSFVTSINIPSAEQIVTISNTGNAPLTINSTTLGGQSPGRFTQRNINCPLAPATLPAGGMCEVGVTYTPQGTNPRSALLNVNVAAPAVNQSVVLNGTTARPISAVAPTALTFSGQRINTTSPPQTVTVSNIGTAPMTITGIALTGGNAPRYAIQSNNCPATLAAGASCTVGVTFRPIDTRTRTASLSVNVLSPATRKTVSLSGTGVR